MTIADLKPYPGYKPSGVEWLGEFPAHWETRRIKNWLTVNQSVLPEDTDPDYVFDYLEIGSIGTGRIVEAPETVRFEDSPSRARRIVKSGDTIVSTVRTYLKAVWHADHPNSDLVASTGFAVLTPRSGAYPKFVSYLCQSEAFINRVVGESVGVAYPAIAETKLANFHVGVPPVPEQSAIVRFLDHADRRIRRSIRSKEKLIALLEEQKQAVIHQAVTGRVDVRTGQPYPAYKPSGVEGLGDVPAHWETRRIKNWLAVNQSVLPEDTDPNYAFDYLEVGSIGTGRIVEAPETIRFEDSPSRARRIVKSGDTIVSAVRTYLKAVWHADHLNSDLVASTGFAVLTPRSGAYPKFVNYLCQSEAFTSRVAAESVGVAYPAIAETKLASFHVGVPSVSEQIAIVHFVDQATTKLDKRIADARREIYLLREYRTRLIADVVTGKLDVREAAATLPEESSDPDAAEADCAEPEGGDDDRPDRDRRTAVPTTQEEMTP